MVEGWVDLCAVVLSFYYITGPPVILTAACRTEVLPATCNFIDVPLYVMRATENRDYCEADDFEPSCGDNSVVVMTTAQYGRMRLGSCVREDLGYVGCKSNVLPHVDWRCSAKPSCKIRIPDGELDQTRPCPGELKTYLEASYICVQGLWATVLLWLSGVDVGNQ